MFDCLHVIKSSEFKESKRVHKHVLNLQYPVSDDHFLPTGSSVHTQDASHGLDVPPQAGPDHTTAAGHNNGECLQYTVRPHLSAPQISSSLTFSSSFYWNKSAIILLYTILLFPHLSSSLTLSTISSRTVVCG